MHDPFRVSCIQSIRYFDPDLEQPIHFHRLARDQVLQRRAVEILHHDERMPVLLADLMNRANVRMVQSRSGARLAAKPLKSLRVAHNIVWQELQRHEAAELSILGLIHNAHASAAEFFNNAIVRNRAANKGQGIRHGWRTS
jgi:hypothetical protein